MKVENCQRFFRPCKCINHPFMCLRVLEEGVVAVTTAALEAETDASLETWWLAERSAAAGYIVIVVSASFGVRGVMR